MATDVETIIRTAESGIRISIDASWDDADTGAYLHFIARHGTMGVVLTNAEAQAMIEGLQKVLAAAA